MKSGGRMSCSRDKLFEGSRIRGVVVCSLPRVSCNLYKGLFSQLSFALDSELIPLTDSATMCFVGRSVSAAFRFKVCFTMWTRVSEY